MSAPTPPPSPQPEPSAATSSAARTPSPGAPESSEVDLSKPQRQSKLAVIFLAVSIIRKLGFVQAGVLLLLFVRAGAALSIGAITLVVVGVLGFLSYLTWRNFTFQISGGELVVERGVWSTRRLSIPAERIQSLSIEQELLHRVFGAVKVTVDTAGSDSSEFELSAIKRPVAEQLQRVVLAERSAADVAVLMPGSKTGGVAGTQQSDTVVLMHSSKRLVTAALTAWPVAALVLGPIAVVLNQFSDVSETVVDTATRSFEWWWIPAGISTAVMLGVLFNLAGTLIQDHQLTLRHDDQTLRRTSGLLSLTSQASAIDRVQVVTSTQNPLQYRVGLTHVKLATIGSGDLGFIGCDTKQITEVRRLTELTSTVTATDERPHRRVSTARIWLTLRNTFLAAAAGATLVWPLLGWWAMLMMLLPISTSAAQWRRVRNFRWQVDHRLITVDHLVDRVTTEALIRKANAVTVSQTIFERRRNLASVTLATAAGSVRVGMLPLDEARAVRDVVLHAAETTRRRWI